MIRYIVRNDEKIGGKLTEYRIELSDSAYIGEPIERVASSGFFNWVYDILDYRDFFANPVQKSALELNLRIESDAERGIIQEIIDAQEDRFRMSFFINDGHEWSGKVLNDLMEYPESPVPFSVKITAKDLSNLEGVEFEYVQSALNPQPTRLSVLLADCLKQTGFNLPIRSYTNITNSNANVNQDNDFLFSLFHTKLALVKTAVRTSETLTTVVGEPFNCLEVLENICRAYKLNIKQSRGKWVVASFPALAKGDYKSWDYDSDGLNPVEVPETAFKEYIARCEAVGATEGDDLYMKVVLNSLAGDADNVFVVNNRTSFLKRTSVNRLSGALKEYNHNYNHRTWIQNFPQGDAVIASPSQTIGRTFNFEGNAAGFRLTFNFDVEVTLQSPLTGAGTAFAQIILLFADAPNRYYDQDLNQFVTGVRTIEVDIDGLADVWTGTFAQRTVGGIPSGATGVRFVWGGVDIGAAPLDNATYHNINSLFHNNSFRDMDALVKYNYNRSGSFSIISESPATVLGDGPTVDSFGRPYWGNLGTNGIPPGTFRIRGVDENLLLEQVTLREEVNTRRSAALQMNADMWADYRAGDVIYHNGRAWFFLGGNMTGRRSKWNVEILQLAYNPDTTGDVFRQFVEAGGDPSGASLGTGIITGGGITLEQADGRYLQQTNNLSDLTDVAQAKINLDLSPTSNVEFGSLTLGGLHLSDGLIEQDGDLTIDVDNLFIEGEVRSTGDFIVRAGGDIRLSANEGEGDVFIDGETIKVDKQISTADSIIIINDKDEGPGMTPEYAGLQIHVPDADDYFVVFRRDDEQVVIGNEGDPVSEWQPLLTRRDAGDLEDTGLLLWDATGLQAYNSHELTFDDSLLTFPDALVTGDMQHEDFALVGGITDGWRLRTVDSKGELDISLIRADELRVKAFIAEISAALYGEDILTKSRGVLASRFVVPAVSGTATLHVEDLEGLAGFQVFEDNDWVLLRVVDRAGGGLNVFNVWGLVTNYTDLEDGSQTWTFTRQAGGTADTGDVVNGGSVAIDYGQSGDGVIIRSVLNSDAPTDTIFTWVTSPVDAGNFTLRTLTGNLSETFYDDGGFNKASGTPLEGFGFASDNMYLTGQLLIGDISKAGTYLEYADGSLEAVLDRLYVETTNLLIDSENELLTVGTVFSADGGADEVVLIADADNAITVDPSGVDIKSTAFRLKALDIDDAGLDINSLIPSISFLGEGAYESVVMSDGDALPGAVTETWDDSVADIDWTTTTGMTGFIINSSTVDPDTDEFPVSVYGDISPPQFATGEWGMEVLVTLARGNVLVFESVSSVRLFFSHNNRTQQSFELAHIPAGDETYFLRVSVVVNGNIVAPDPTPDEFVVSGIEFKQHRPKSVFNELGVLQRISESIVIGLGSSTTGGSPIISTTTAWNEVTNKPFETIGEGLAVDGEALRVNLDGITSGTLSLDRIPDIPNVKLENSTISGVALGGTLSALTAGNGLTAGGTYTGATARTFALGTPQTLSSTSSNSVSGTTHSHAIETFPVTGNEDQVLITGVGRVLGQSLSFRLPQDIAAHSEPDFAGLNISEYAQDMQFFPGTSGTGWSLTRELAEVESLRVRDEFRTHIFKAEVMKGINGRLLVSDVSEIVQSKQMTVGSGRTLKVRHGTGYATFEVGQTLEVRGLSPGGIEPQYVRMEVTAVDNIPSAFEAYILRSQNAGAFDGDDIYMRSVLRALTGDEIGVSVLTVDVEIGGTVYEGDSIIRVSGATVLIDSNDEDAPFIDALFDEQVMARFGNLDGIPNASDYGLYGANTYLTGYLLIGDLTKTGSYFEVDSGDLDIVADMIKIDTPKFEIDSENLLVAIGDRDVNDGMYLTMDTHGFNVWNVREDDPFNDMTISGFIGDGGDRYGVIRYRDFGFIIADDREPNVHDSRIVEITTSLGNPFISFTAPLGMNGNSISGVGSLRTTGSRRLKTTEFNVVASTDETYAVQDDDEIIEIKDPSNVAGSEFVSVNLPSATLASQKDRRITIVESLGKTFTYHIEVDGGAGSVDGTTSPGISRHGHITVYCDGTIWKTISYANTGLN
jgi:hypothetical protein